MHFYAQIVIKKARQTWSIIKLVIVYWLLSLADPVWAKTVVLGAEEWYPYISPTLEDKGFTGRIIKEAFALSKIDVEFRIMPWARALKMTKEGTIDGTFLWYKTPEREPFFFFSQEPVANITVVFFHLKKFDFTWETLDDLKKYRIGATIGYHISDQFDEYDKAGKINVHRIKSDTQILKMMIRGRLDLFPQDILVGYGQIYQAFPRHIAMLFTNNTKPLTSRPAYLLLTKQDPANQALVKLFDKGLKELKDSGQFDAYFDELISGSSLP
ncbi:substrate-binding periplasmic protein [Zooshikella harenae]|uniref:Transporter substrate-binding domain-containing protein n=1 Tax=Zooshikella harenae TaxID=2827238 RepID=A0ABS5ZBH4_9GAMM|nr:transporter substrate-binding domain-containing protein [Zooshikella harenae]MBU2711108.1 transporter substrate-binding domain-containing protein [Zooshikella harenae]